MIEPLGAFASCVGLVVAEGFTMKMTFAAADEPSENASTTQGNGGHQ